jgi:hypothetical protein
MRVSLDGGVTWKEAQDGVRVDYDLGGIYNRNDHRLLFNLTSEGLIVDETIDGEVVLSEAKELADMVGFLV